MEIEPIDPHFEAEVAHLAGERRKGESVEDHLARIGRVRRLLRLEQSVDQAAARQWAADAEAADCDPRAWEDVPEPFREAQRRSILDTPR